MIFDLLSGLTDLNEDIKKKDSPDGQPLTWPQFARTGVAALATLAGAWAPVLKLVGGQTDPASTLLLTYGSYGCSFVALLLAYPIGYLGQRLATAAADRLGLESARWLIIGVGVVILGLLAGALPWLLLVLVTGCSLDPQHKAGQC